MGFGVWCLVFVVWSLVLGVWGLEFGVWSLRFKFKGWFRGLRGSRSKRLKSGDLRDGGNRGLAARGNAVTLLAS